MRKILTMCSVLLLVPLAADAVEVKVTGFGTDSFFDWGYYITYTVNGRTYRSDEVGQRINQIAWEHMSEQDKKNVIDAYGTGGGNAILEQFGDAGENGVKAKINGDAGWTEAQRKYQEALAYRDLPTHAEIFEDDAKREAYFKEHFVPHWPEGTEVAWNNEMLKCMDEQKLVWNWAYETYLTLKRGNERKIQTATQALSGDLIALICDKVLVPNIMATKLNPIELGLKYGMRKEVWGAVFDYANTISQFGDELTKSVIGERASGDSGAELIAKLTDLINMDLHFINLCMTRLRDNVAAIQSMGVAEAAEQKRRAEELAAKEAEDARRREDALAAAPMDGNPPDPVIEGKKNEYDEAISTLNSQYRVEYESEEPNPERLNALKAGIESKEAARRKYVESIRTDVQERFAAWASACSGWIETWYDRSPEKLHDRPAGLEALDEVRSRPDFSSTGFEISGAAVKSQAATLIQYYEMMETEVREWAAEGIPQVLSFRNSYQEIFTDACAIDYGDLGEEVTQANSKLHWVEDWIWDYAGAREQSNWQSLIDECREVADAYAEAEESYHKMLNLHSARREELAANLDLAEIAYYDAFADMSNLVSRLPDWLSGCTADVAQILQVPKSSKLWQDVFGDGKTANVSRLRQYCKEANDLYAQYLAAEHKKDVAWNCAESYWAELYPNPQRYGQFPELEMSAACYQNLYVLKAAVRDLNLQVKDGYLMECFAVLSDNKAYYSGEAEPSGETELPTYEELCNEIARLRDESWGFADSVEGYSPNEDGDLCEDLIDPLLEEIKGKRLALSWYYDIEGGKARITGIGGVASGSVAIPESLEGCPVTELGDHLFTGSSAMTAVTIPESVTTIGACAFSGCTQLARIRIPAQVASIGESAFVGCDSLMQFEVAAGNRAYRAVNGLLFAKGGTDPIAGIGGDVTVPPGVKRIGTEVFYERALGSVTLPPGVVEIGERAFAYSTLKEITIPASVTTIAGDAFYSCDQLVTVYVDKGDNDRVRELLRDAGASLSRITIVSEFTETVDGIEWSYATANGEAVVTAIAEKPEGESYGKVEVPSTLGGLAVTGIGNSVFMWRSDITEVVIPQGVRSIGDYAFNSSPSIKTVTLPRSLTQVGNLTFAYSSLTTVRTAPGDTARMKSLMTKGGLSVSVNWVENDDPAERPEIIDTPTDGAVPQGRCVSLDFEKVLGLEVPADVDYAAGDKVTIKVEGLAKGLKVVATPVYADPNAKKKVIVGYKYTIEGVPTEPVDFEKQPMFARVTVTYKDKTKGDKGKVETLQPIVLSIATPEPSVLTAGALNAVYGPVDIAALWPTVADAKTNPKDWSFKGWPAGLKYANGVVSGKPTKAGEYPITATWKHKLVDGKTTVSETFSAVLTVWGDDGASDFRAVSQAYVALTKNFGTGVTAMSGLPTGLKFTAKAVAATAKAPAQEAGDVYGTPTKPGVFAVTATKSDKTKETFLWKVTEGENPGLDAAEIGWSDAKVKFDGETKKATILQGLAADFAVDASALAAGAKVTVSGLPAGLKYDAKAGTITGVATKQESKVVTVKVVQNGVTMTTTFAIVVDANPFAGTYYGFFVGDGQVGRHVATAVITPAAGGTAKLVFDEYVPSKKKTIKYTATAKGFTMVDYYPEENEGATVIYEFDIKADAKNNPDFAADERKMRVALRWREHEGLDFIGGEAALGATDSSLCPVMKTLNATEYSKFVDFGLRAPVPILTGVCANETGHVLYYSAVFDAKKAQYQVTGKLADGTAVKALLPLVRWEMGWFTAPFLLQEKKDEQRTFAALFKMMEGFSAFEYWTAEQMWTLTCSVFDTLPATAAEQLGGESELVLDAAELADFGYEGEAPVFRLMANGAELAKAKLDVYAPDAKEGAKPLASLASAKLQASAGYVFKGSFKWDAKVGGDGNTYSFELVPSTTDGKTFVGRCEVKPAKGMSVAVGAWTRIPMDI
ncbi:MAG: leucine-rich repeat protein [bacterium]|nr:leucine-rich repeat protein [bacterium]